MIPKETWTAENGLPDGWTATADATINAVMRALRVSPKLLGYRYIFLAAHLILTARPLDRMRVRRDLYAMIGETMGTTKPMIIRSVRYAISQAWKAADPEVLRSYLGGVAGSLREPPGNIEYIYLVAERVRLIVGDPLEEAFRKEAERRLASRFPWLND